MSARVRIEHLRALGYCARGSREFCARHGIDWAAMLRQGVSAAELERTGDAMALAAVQRARDEQRSPGVVTKPEGGAHG